MERIKINGPIENRQNETIEELSNKLVEGPIKIRDCVNCTIVNCDVSMTESGDMFVLQNCQECTVIDSKFHDKKTRGCAVKVDGNEDTNENLFPNGNVFENCEWFDLEGNCEEPLRIGDSRRSHLFFNTTIRNCTFRNLNADEETISIKSCGNIIENCEHIDCNSSITIRHGHSNTIAGCSFAGKDGGIRVYGKDNMILGNTFTRNKSNKHYPLRLHKAERDSERHEGSSKTEHQHTDHTQVINNEISGNTFDNCEKCVRWGEDSGKFKPDLVQFINNKVIADQVPSVVIDFGNDEQPFIDHEGNPLQNEFADNEVIGTQAIIDHRVNSGFKEPITAL